MPDFPTQFDSHDRIFANPGDPIKILYAPQVDKQGHLELIESGTEDLYEYIQSHAESVDINMIVARYQRGDIDALERVQGLYADVTGLPQTYADMLNVVIQGEHAFESLPLETRAKFNHSYYEWMASMDDFAGFAAKMGFKMPEVDVVAGDQEKTAIRNAVSPGPQDATSTSSAPADSQTSPSAPTPSQ